jgi:dinuclear metal center YbgI/SA1388 family protein
MTVNELYACLNEKIPPSLSCPWDNDGMMCCPDPEAKVGRVLVALDVTADVVRQAREGAYDLIVSHHPLIFSPLSSVTVTDPVAKKVIRLLRADVAAMSFHTRLDAVEGGVNDMLAALLDLSDVTPFGSNGEEIGRIGTLETEATLADFANSVKKVLQAPVVLYADAGLTVKRVAVLGGEGGDDISAARAAGADTYVSGRLGYHNMTDAPEMGMNLIEAGHFYTEHPVCAKIVQMIAEADKNIQCSIYFSNRTELI